jgi:hypothetical protein
VHAAGQKHYLLGVSALTCQQLLGFIMYAISYSQYVTCVPFDGIAQFLYFQNIIQVLCRVFLGQWKEVIFQVLRGVGLKLAEKHYILIIVKREVETQGI